jgi:uncharacterized membrane protein
MSNWLCWGSLMVETKEGQIGKPRIETLSDLIFGLALSIGALTLVGQPATSFEQLVSFIIFYAFSFIILISVWFGYTRNMSHLRIETGNLLFVNVLLLFLVSIEPFLFNLLFEPFAENVSLLYALDLGSLFLIQTYLSNAVLSVKTLQPDVLYTFKLHRNTFLISSLLFFVSILPFFWSWRISFNENITIPLRVVVWFIPLTLPGIRRLWLRRKGK